jgi:hypothetical protein
MVATSAVLSIYDVGMTATIDKHTRALDQRAMGSFDNAGVDAEFFPDGTRKSILLVTLGYGDDSKLFPRNPRPDFEEIASFA